MRSINSTLLTIGSPKDSDKYCKYIIENRKEGRSFILSLGYKVLSYAKFENVQSMINIEKNL